jgi:hypothetical protein
MGEWCCVSVDRVEKVKLGIVDMLICGKNEHRYRHFNSSIETPKQKHTKDCRVVD